MEIKIGKSDWSFLLACLFVGVFAEESFFREQIGISYLAFVVVFYSLFFWRFLGFRFSHQRIGYLLLSCVWLLSSGYFLFDSQLFYSLNLLVIPMLVIFHLVLITSPKQIEWNKPNFLLYIAKRIGDALAFNFSLVQHSGKFLKQGVNEEKYLLWKKILIGVALSIPVLFVVLNLLMSADQQFERIIGGFPHWFQVVTSQNILRCVVIAIYTIGFFGLLQVLFKKKIGILKQSTDQPSFTLDSVISLTVLLLINAVYVLFVLVQFKYFFSGSLLGDYTFAQYARRGFFELLFVSMINLSITVLILTFVVQTGKATKRFTQYMLSILILTTGVILTSSFLRMLMYEEAYGYTFTRVIVQTFMIFLAIIIMYTLVKVWLEKLSLFHFYFITSILYYTAINLVNLDQIVVTKNMDRFEQTAKVDVHYLNSISNTGVLGLIELYKRNPRIPELENILTDRQMNISSNDNHWQSFNLTRKHESEELKKLTIN
jgi:hypothetical protein